MIIMLDHKCSPNAGFINDNFHHLQPLPENYNFSAIRVIWKYKTLNISTNPIIFNIENSEVIFRLNLTSAVQRVQAYL